MRSKVVCLWMGSITGMECFHWTWEHDYGVYLIVVSLHTVLDRSALPTHTAIQPLLRCCGLRGQLK